MMAIRSFLFDAGNTLVELDFVAVAGAFSKEGLRVPPEELRRAAGEGRAALDRYLRERSASTEHGETLAFFFSVICEGAGIPDTEIRPRVLSRLAPRIHQLWRVPAEGAREVAERLTAEGFRLGVVSNSDGTIERILAGAGLEGLFETVVDSGVVGVEKPDPAIFRIALDRMGVPPEEAVYVGDLPCVDVEGALAAGIAPVLLDPWDAFPEAAVPRIRSLRELPLPRFGLR